MRAVFLPCGKCEARPIYDTVELGVFEDYMGSPKDIYSTVVEPADPEKMDKRLNNSQWLMDNLWASELICGRAATTPTGDRFFLKAYQFRRYDGRPNVWRVLAYETARWIDAMIQYGEIESGQLFYLLADMGETRGYRLAVEQFGVHGSYMRFVKQKDVEL